MSGRRVVAWSDSLVGRGAELEAVAAFLDAVPAGGAELTIEGEAGIGKSELVRAALDESRARGHIVLSSRPSPADAQMSFSGLDDLLHDALDSVAPVLPEPQRRALEVALLVREAEEDAPSPLAVALGVRGILLGLSDSAPVVVAIDDMQWLDEPTARSLDHAMRRLEASPVGLLSARQLDVGRRRPPLSEEHRKEGRHLRLGPLSRSDIGRLLGERLGMSLSRGRLDLVHRTCRGNPLAALEIGRAILQSGAAAWTSRALPVPGDVAMLMRARLSGLTGEERRVLLLVAAAPAPSRALVEEVAGVSSAHTLEKATDEGVLTEDADGFRFTHPLLGAVLYADADHETLRAVHASLAAAIVEPEERAMHMALSTDEPDSSVAASIEGAARGARMRGAPSAAAELCEQARRLTPADHADDARRRAILEAEFRLDAGEPARARELLEEVVRSAPSGPTRAMALQRLGWVRYHQDSWTSAVELLDAAADEASREPQLRAAVDLDRAVACQLSGDLAGAAAHAEAAADRARSIGDAGLEREADAMVASVDFLLGRGIADEVIERAVEEETWNRARPTAAQPSVAYGVLLKWSDRLPASRAQLSRALTRAEERGAERSLPYILYHLAEVRCWMGDWDGAWDDANRATQIAATSGQEAGRAFGLAAQALVSAHRGREAETRAIVTEGLEVAVRTGAVPAALLLTSMLGFLELSLGRLAAAHRHLGPLVESAAAEGITEPGGARYLGDGLEVLVRLGELELAERVTTDLTQRSAELDRAWGLMVGARTRGLACSAVADLPGARAALDEALAQNERLSQPFELGRTLLARGGVERRDRQKRSARALLEQALEVFSNLGADLWIQRARSELERISGRAPIGVELSETEERIAQLTAEGATNQEVGASLFLTAKTVEWYLSRIYRKLGIRSRTELARWMGTHASPGSASGRLS